MALLAHHYTYLDAYTYPRQCLQIYVRLGHISHPGAVELNFELRVQAIMVYTVHGCVVVQP